MLTKTAAPATLRLASASDIKAIAQVEAACYPDAWTEEDISNFFSYDNATGILACINGVVAGFCLYETVGQRLHVTDIAVLPSVQGAGLGSLLMRQAIDTARALGRRRVTLEVRRSNEKAIRLYKRLGFRRVRVKRAYYPDGEDGIYMALRLV